MKNLINRIEDLEAIARRWNIDNKVYTSFDQYKNTVREDTWSQKVGRKRGQPITFETPRAALDWVINQLGRGAAQIYVDDIREIMDDKDIIYFDLYFPDAPDYSVWFDLRNGQDVITEAIWHWRYRTLAGIKYKEWWEAENKHIDELTQWANEQLENLPDKRSD